MSMLLCRVILTAIDEHGLGNVVCCSEAMSLHQHDMARRLGDVMIGT